jgi:hypothetical protein
MCVAVQDLSAGQPVRVLVGSQAFDHTSRGVYVDLQHGGSGGDESSAVATPKRQRSFRFKVSSKGQSAPANSGEEKPLTFSFWALIDGVPGRGGMSVFHKAKPNYDLTNRMGADSMQVVRIDNLIRSGRVYFEVTTKNGMGLEVSGRVHIQ